MKVIDHEPHAWFLLGEGDELLLDVHCEHSALSYSVLVVLNEEERRNYQQEGRDYLSHLAHAIHYSAPCVRGSASPYRERNVDKQRGDEVLAAVRSWRAALSAA